MVMFIGISWEGEAQMCSLLCVRCVGDRPSEAMSCLNQSRVTRGTRIDYNCSVWLVSNLRCVRTHVRAHLFLLVWMRNMSAGKKWKIKTNRIYSLSEQQTDWCRERQQQTHEESRLCLKSDQMGNVSKPHTQWTEKFTRLFLSPSKNFTRFFISSKYFTLNVMSHSACLSSCSLSVPLFAAVYSLSLSHTTSHCLCHSLSLMLIQTAVCTSKTYGDCTKNYLWIKLI